MLMAQCKFITTYYSVKIIIKDCYYTDIGRMSVTTGLHCIPLYVILHEHKTSRVNIIVVM